ncbi:MAG: OmpH family outer membrane protein [Rickettsiaceae bacterium]|nr:OmpH family outer membrane protein [Rickettsiaceae bacterium]
MQKKKSFYFILLVFACYVFCHSVFAVGNIASTNIAVINTELILEKSTAIQQIRDSMKQMSSTIENDLTQKEIELKMMEYDLLQKREVLSEEEYTTQLAIFNDRVSEVQKLVHSRKQSLEETHRASRQKVYDKLSAIIQQLSDEYQFDIVLPFSQLVFARDHLDITDTVLDKLNKEKINFTIKYEK